MTQLITITTPKVHYFHDDCEAYDASQCDEGIHNGDVLVCASSPVAILIEAWPTQVNEGRSEFHRMGQMADWAAFPSIQKEAPDGYPDGSAFDLTAWQAAPPKAIYDYRASLALAHAQLQKGPKALQKGDHHHAI